MQGFTSVFSDQDSWSGNSSLWKYMDLYAFLGLISTKELFFTNLPQFEDQYEGYTPAGDRTTLGLNLARQNYILRDAKLVQENIERRELQKQITYASSWRMSPDECYLMWQTYGSKKNGIAIKSSVNRLVAALQNPDQATFGPVRYIDYMKDTIGDRPDIEFAFHKQKGYASEQEFRACIVNEHKNNDGPLKATVNLSELIEEVVLSPWGQDWQAAALTKTLEAMKLEGVKVRKSKIVGITKS